MKKLLNTLSIVACILGTSLNAQTSKTSSGSAQDQVQADPNSAKSRYILDQNYLSSSTLKDYRNYYGDSLKGFDEAAVKAELISRLYFGQEFTTVMNWRKRDFIDSKYKIGDYAPKPPKSTPKAGGKPVGGGNGVNVAPCVNEDFEATAPGSYNNQANAVTGWVVESTNNAGKTLACGLPTNFNWTQGSPEFSIVTTPIFGHPYIGNIPNSPLGGNNVAQLNNTAVGSLVTRISTTFPVTPANTVFQFAYAGSWDGSGHLCCDQPFFTINMYDCNNNPLTCSSISLTPKGPNCPQGGSGYSLTPGGISWCNWQIQYIDLTPYLGSCVTIRVTNGDCNGGAHHGSLYFDAKCGGNVICSNCTPISKDTTKIPGPVSYCVGSGVALLTSPSGYASYSWTAPPGATPIPPSQATLQNLPVTNPSTGAVYTVMLNSYSGCNFVSTVTIQPTTVKITGIASGPSCAGGSSGTATVIGHGSGSGYNYSWRNFTGSVVGTSSVATGLAPGTYSIIISGIGAAGCGGDTATVVIGTTPPGVINSYVPFCGVSGSSSANIVTHGGTNAQWYGPNLAPIPGATTASLFVSPANTGDVYTLKYTSIFGCNDSIRFTLAATNPGLVAATNISWICPGGTNGTAIIKITPSSGAPTGFNFFSVTALGTTPPYVAATAPTAQTSFSIGNLAAGTYSIRAFDGACYYNNTFSVTPFVFNYNITPPVTLCSGNSVNATVTFPTPPSLAQYSYSWSPANNIVGSGNSNAIITPTVAKGTQSLFIYYVTVTPSVVNCPVTKAVSITVINPPTPTFVPIPNLCNTFAPYQILATPPGGTFATGMTGTNNPISASGLINPSLAVNGTNTMSAPGTYSFSYAITQFTCKATNTGTYHVSRYWSSALSSTVPPLCVTSPQFNLMNIVQNTQNGSWQALSFPTSMVTSGNLFNPSGLNTGTYVAAYTTSSTPNFTVCPSTTTLQISVTKTITPVITPKPEFCTNAAAFTMTATPAGGGWIPVNGLTNAGVVTPGIIGVNTLAATYTVNVGPCLNTNTTILNITRFVPATLTGTINSLCYNSSPINLLSIVQQTTGTWSGAAGVLTNSFFPAGLPSGMYTALYSTASTPNATLCPDQRTINIGVLNPQMPSISQVGPYCNTSNPFQLNVVPSNGYWITSPYVSSSGVFTPKLASLGNNPVQYAVGTTTCNRTEIKYISIEAFVPATITNKLPDLCNNSPIMNLSPFTLNNQGLWSGPGISGTNFNPALTGSGSFELTYKTSSSPSGLCPDIASISVNVFSLAAPAITQSGPFCTNSLPVQLKVSPVGGLFGGSDVGIVSLGGKFNPGLAHIGDNIVNYTVTSGPCIAFAQTVVKVEKFINADFYLPPAAFCKTDEPVNMNAFVQNPGGDWSTGNGMIGNMFNPSLANSGKNNLITYYTYSSPTRTLCPDQSTINIDVREMPKVAAIASKNEACAPSEILFNTPSATSGEGIWTFDDGSEPKKGLTSTHIFTSPGEYNVQFNYADDIGCKAEPVRVKTIRILEVPKADFTVPEEIFISDGQVQLTNISTVLGNNTYQWKIPGISENRTEVNPMFTFPKIGKYQITLTATTYKGCVDEITKTIEVKNNFNVFIPNSFTPNFDGLNDYFMPTFSKEGIDPKNFDMEVFDRWGHSVFHTKDVTSKGWDGSVNNKGEASKQDVYVYKIRYKDMDGGSHEKIGNVSLIK